MPYYVLLLCSLLLRFSACSELPAAVTKDDASLRDLPSRRVLARAAMQSDKWQFVLGGKTWEDQQQLRAMLEGIVAQMPLEAKIEILTYDDLATAKLGQSPLLFVGNTWPAIIAQYQPGLSYPASFNGLELSQAADVLQINYALNPWSLPDTAHAMHLVFSPTVAVLRNYLYERFSNDWGQLLFAAWDYEIYRADKPLLKGQFQRNGWEIDPLAELSFPPFQTPIYTDLGWVCYALDEPPSGAELAVVTDKLNQVRENIYQQLGLLPLQAITLHLYPSVERIGLRRQSMEVAQYEPSDTTVHLVLQPNAAAYQSPAVYHAIIQAINSQHSGALEASAPLAATAAMLALWCQATQDDSYWQIAQALAAHQQLLRPQQLLNQAERAAISTYLFDASLLAFTDYLLQTKAATLAALVAGKWSDEWLEIPEDWQSRWLSTQMARDETTQLASPRAPATAFQRGMTFAHEGYQTYNGYGGHLVAPSLDSLAALAVNSVAVVPYTFLPAPNQLGEMPVSNFAGGENDEAVIHAIRQAHQRNWTVLLKPQIWVRGAWPGDINFQTKAEWETFFQRYTQWIAHYAILAEQEEVAALCLGTEMLRSTIDHPDKWREIIRLVRSLYSGQLTYAANWGEEFDHFSFWEELDYIGLNAYYPLSSSEMATNEELVAGARQWVQKAEAAAKKQGKAWQLTEVGFRSVAQAWKNPHADAAGRPADAKVQARCYQALLQALKEDAPSLQGVYVWKWPSYLGRERRGTEFTPGGKPAAELLKRFYLEQL